MIGEDFRRGEGRLLAAGVIAAVGGTMLLVAAVLTAVLAIGLGPDDGCIGSSSFLCLDGSDRGAFQVFAAVVGVVGLFFLVAGIGGCRRTRWGRFGLMAGGGIGAIWLAAQGVRTAGLYSLAVVMLLTAIAVLAGTGTPRDPQERNGG